MFQKYYSDNLISKFIKCLLWDTYVPTVDIWRQGKPLIAGFTYITNDKYIVKAKKDFKPLKDISSEIYDSSNWSYWTMQDQEFRNVYIYPNARIAPGSKLDGELFTGEQLYDISDFNKIQEYNNQDIKAVLVKDSELSLESRVNTRSYKGHVGTTSQPFIGIVPSSSTLTSSLSFIQDMYIKSGSIISVGSTWNNIYIYPNDGPLTIQEDVHITPETSTSYMINSGSYLADGSYVKKMSSYQGSVLAYDLRIYTSASKYKLEEDVTAEAHMGSTRYLFAFELLAGSIIKAGSTLPKILSEGKIFSTLMLTESSARRIATLPTPQANTYIIFKSNHYIANIVTDSWDKVDEVDTEGPKSSLDSSYFELISPYVPGERYNNITTSYKSNSAIYDPTTHYYLGQYLRMIRDIDGIDLMPFYNCYSGEMSDKIRIVEDIIISNNDKKDGYNTYIVPIKFSKNYTIYFNAAVPFKIMPAYYNGFQVWPVLSERGEALKSTTVNYCSNTQPFVYNELSFQAGKFRDPSNSAAKLIEDYLVLLIQVPESIKSNLTVLEENFDPYLHSSGFNALKINNNPYQNTLPEISIYANNFDAVKENGSIDAFTLNKLYKPVSDLPLLSGSTSYAFDNTLIQYLLQNVITSNEKIRDNILRLQECMSSSKAKKLLGETNYYSIDYSKDIWDANLRAYIYNLITQKSTTPLHLNVNGFVDKDAEFIIDKFKENNKVWGE